MSGNERTSRAAEWNQVYWPAAGDSACRIPFMLKSDGGAGGPTALRIDAREHVPPREVMVEFVLELLDPHVYDEARAVALEQLRGEVQRRLSRTRQVPVK